jgi:hypothetical protein
VHWQIDFSSGNSIIFLFSLYLEAKFIFYCLHLKILVIGCSWSFATNCNLQLDPSRAASLRRPHKMHMGMDDPSVANLPLGDQDVLRPWKTVCCFRRQRIGRGGTIRNPVQIWTLGNILLCRYHCHIDGRLCQQSLERSPQTS